jgi:putative intracellular protease/amidase
MHCVKLLGQRLSARDFDRQVAEFQVRVAVLNGFTALGIPSRMPWDESVRGKGNLGPQTICATVPGADHIAEVDLDACDAIFLAGGQSPTVTMIDDTPLHAFVARAFEAGKIVAVVCHGTCVLLKTRLSNGDLLVKGRTWTGFADSEEAYADALVGMKIQPFWIEEEARKIPETNFIFAGMFKPFVVQDGNLITDQQQYSGAAAAELVIEALGR